MAAGPMPLPAVPEPFKDASQTVTTIAASTGEISQEALLAAKPDFVIGSYDYVFSGDGVYTEQELADKGIATYWSLGKGGCMSDDADAPRTDLEGTFRDLENLGKIFDKQEEAMALVASLRADLATAVASVDSTTKLRVATANIGELTEGAPGYYGSASAVNAIITLAGGVNVFGDLPDAYATTTLEELVKRDPEVIMVIGYPFSVPEDWDQAEAFLTSNPALANISAVKNQRFVRVVFPEVGAGGVRNVDGVKKLAAELASTTG